MHFSETLSVGTLPSTLGSLSKVATLNFYNNELTGIFLKHQIWLFENDVLVNIGTIPSAIGGMSSLTNLQLYSNSLIGLKMFDFFRVLFYSL